MPECPGTARASSAGHHGRPRCGVLRRAGGLGSAVGSQPDDRGCPPLVEHVLTKSDVSNMSTTITQTKPRRALPPLMSLTDAAADRLRALYSGGQAGQLLRIGVSTKGCSGMSYEMSWVDAPA